MAITVRVGGVDRTSRLAASSIVLDRKLAFRASARFHLRDTGGWRPALGQYVEIDDGTTPLFRGWIWRIEERLIIGAGTTEAEVECVDLHHVAARRLLRANYSGWYLPNIINHIVTVGLSDEGITVTGSPPNQLIAGSLSFYYTPVAQALRQLADIAGCVWYIDHQKRLHFETFTARNATWQITDDNRDVYDLRVTRTLEDYRNKQWVRTEIPQLGDEWTESLFFPGPGSWMVSTRWVVYQVYEISVGGVAKTIKAVDPSSEQPPESGYDFWHWIGAGGIYNLDWQAPEGGAYVDVRYRPGDPWEQQEYGLKVIAEADDDEIQRMKGLTGGSGLWEAIEDTKAGVNPDGMVAIAQARLRRYARDGIRATAEIGRRDLEPGMRIVVNSSMFGISQALFCERVRWTIRWSPFGEIVRIEAELSDAEPSAAAGTNYFAKLVEMARTGVGAGGGGAGAPGEWSFGWTGPYVLVDAETVGGSVPFTRELLSGTTYGVNMMPDDPPMARELYATGSVQKVTG